MATFHTSRYVTTLSFLILYFKTLTANPDSSFYFKNFGHDSNFESQLALYGNTEVVNGGSSLQLTGSSNFRAGRVLYKKSIKFVQGNPRTTVSFSTYFSFSMSPGNGDGLAFLMVPIGVAKNVFDDDSFGLFGKRKFKVLCIEFGDVNGKIDVRSPVSVKVSNISSIHLVLNNGEELQAWIGYEAGSKQLEVRLSRLGQMRPTDPLLSYIIDLSLMWKEEEEVIVGLSSSSGNSSHKCNVYSWSFKTRQVPHWMHSQPLDPKAFVEKTKALTTHERSDCLLRILGSLIFGTGIGALGAFVVLFTWTIFGNRRPVVPEEYIVTPLEYKRFEVIVDKALKNGIRTILDWLFVIAYALWTL